MKAKLAHVAAIPFDMCGTTIVYSAITNTTSLGKQKMHADKRNTRAQAFKRMRALTLGMKVWTWESWKVADAPDGHPMYGCICKDRWGHDLGKDVFSIAAKISRKWHITIRVKCRADDGQEYVEETELEADNVKLDDFTEVYKREREATIAAVNQKHIVDIGWIARALS